MLQEIKQKIAGSVKARAGMKAVRLRVGWRSSLQNLVERINGYLRNSVPWLLYVSLCEHLAFQPQKASDLTWLSAYTAGLFNADGSISISVAKPSAKHTIIPADEGKRLGLMHAGEKHQLTLMITSRYQETLMMIPKAFGFGKIVKPKINVNSRHANQMYDWYFRSHQDVQAWLNYTRLHPLPSCKKKRLIRLTYYFSPLVFHFFH